MKYRIFDAEPVNLITGEVVVQQHDFTVSGRLPLPWHRYYESHDAFTGIAGAGWRTLADTGMEIVQNKGKHTATVYFANQVATFNHLPDTEGWANRTYDKQYGHAFYLKDANHAIIRTRAGLEYGFNFPEDWRKRAPAPHATLVLAIRLFTLSDLNSNAWHFEWSTESMHDGTTLCITEWWANQPTGRAVHCAPGAQTGRVGRITLCDTHGFHHTLVCYEQDRNDDLVAVRDALDKPHYFEYAGGPHASLHLMVRHTDRNRLSFYYTHRKHADGKWRVDHAWGDNELHAYRFAYDLEYLETIITDASGHESVLQYDDRQLPILHIDSAGGMRSYMYDAQQRTTAEVDEGGNATQWEYDERGNVLAEIRADYSTVRTEYDENSRAVKITDPENGVWQQEWNERGNLVRQRTPLGLTTQYEYDDKGQLVKVTDAAGNVTQLAWDSKGYLAAMTDAQGGVTRLEHDARGKLVSQQNPGEPEPTIYVYGARGWLTACIRPGREPVKYAYDNRGDVIRYTDELNQVTTFEYGGPGKLQSRTSPDGSVTHYHYDTEERLIGITNAVGHTWHLERDAAGKVITERDYWGNTKCYGYDAAGKLARVEDSAGKVTQVQYDRMGRIVQRSCAAEEEHFSWNDRGQLTEARNATGKVTREYDADGKLTREQQEQEGFTGTIVNHYDAAGLLHKQQRTMQVGTVRHQQQLTYGYDALGRMQTVQLDNREPVKLSRDKAGRLSQVEFGDGLAHHLSYDEAGRLMRHETHAKQPLYTHTRYGYDALGRQILKVDSHLGEDNYVYDPLDRIHTHTDPLGKIRQFMHNANGDAILHESRTEEGGRLICHESGVNWRTDAAGQVVIRSGATNEDQYLEWDEFGRLKSLKPRHGHWHYRYDALGRRLCKQNEANGDCTWFLWEGNRLVGEVQRTTGAGAEPEQVFQVRFYVYHQQSLAPLLMQDSGWQGARDKPAQPKVYAYQSEPNGAPARLCDAQGNTVWEGHYAATGRVDYFGDRTVRQTLRLQGQYFDEESGLHYDRQRYFDPLNGQFISLDPAGLRGGLNPYELAPNVFGNTGFVPQKTDLLQKLERAAFFPRRNTYEPPFPVSPLRVDCSHVSCVDAVGMFPQYRNAEQG